MNKKYLRNSVAVLSLITLPGMAHAMGKKPAQPNPDVSGLEAEHTVGPATHTAARDQGDAGFCWAYATSGLIEGEAQRQGKA